MSRGGHHFQCPKIPAHEMIACGSENNSEIGRHSILLQAGLDGDKLKVDLRGGCIAQKTLHQLEVAFDEPRATLLMCKAPANIPEHALFERPNHRFYGLSCQLINVSDAVVWRRAASAFAVVEANYETPFGLLDGDEIGDLPEP